MNDLPQRIRQWRQRTLITYVALLCALLIGQLTAAVFNGKLLLLQLAVLLIFLPGLIRENGKSCVWLSCVLLLYAAKFLSDLIVTHWSWISIVQTLCTIALFASLIRYLQARGKLRKQQPRPPQE